MGDQLDRFGRGVVGRTRAGHLAARCGPSASLPVTIHSPPAREGQHAERAGVSQAADLAAGAAVPHPHRAVAGAGQHAPLVGKERHAADQEIVALFHADGGTAAWAAAGSSGSPSSKTFSGLPLAGAPDQGLAVAAGRDHPLAALARTPPTAPRPRGRGGPGLLHTPAASQIFTRPSRLPETAYRGSAASTQPWTQPPWPRNVVTKSAAAGSAAKLHSLTVLSLPPLASLRHRRPRTTARGPRPCAPSGDNCGEWNDCRGWATGFPRRSCFDLLGDLVVVDPRFISAGQTCTSRSRPAEAIQLPCGGQATA